MPRRKKIEDEPCEHSCHWAECDAPAPFKAPVAPDRPGEYQWLCKDHITLFNKSWDYFRGKSQAEIEAFQKDAMFGHRPTWGRGNEKKLTTQKLSEALGNFMHDATRGVTDEMFAPPINAKDKQALAVLDLSHPCDMDAIKKQYKKLAKANHPDLNPNNKQAEERFKLLTQSYNHLMQGYAKGISEA